MAVPGAGQSPRVPPAQHVGHRGGHQGVTRQLAVRHARVGRAGTGQCGARGGHGAVAVARERVHEVIAAPRDGRDRLLADAGNDGVALVRGGQLCAQQARGPQQLGARLRAACRPLRRLKQIEAAAAVPPRQQLVQAREGTEHLRRQVLGGGLGRDARHLAHHRVGAAQRLHGGERTAVGGAEQHHALDHGGAGQGEGDAREQAAHAVRHDRHARARGRAQPVRECGAELRDRQPPVVVVKLDREALRAQVQLQAQMREQHHAQRDDRRRCRQAQVREAPDLNVDRVDPQHVVRQRRRPLEPELRTHDAGDQHHLQRLRHGALGAPRQRGERGVFARTEVGGEFRAMRAARQPALDLRVAPRKAVVGRDVVERVAVGSHAVRWEHPAAWLTPASAGARAP